LKYPEVILYMVCVMMIMSCLSLLNIFENNYGMIQCRFIITTSSQPAIVLLRPVTQDRHLYRLCL